MRAVWFMHLMSTCDPAVRSDLAQASSHFTREACVGWILYYVPKCGEFWGNYCCLKVKCFFLPICGEIQKQKSWIFAGNISICVLEQLSGIDLPSFMASLPPTWLECSGEGAGTPWNSACLGGKLDARSQDLLSGCLCHPLIRVLLPPFLTLSSTHSSKLWDRNSRIQQTVKENGAVFATPLSPPLSSTSQTHQPTSSHPFSSHIFKCLLLSA